VVAAQQRGRQRAARGAQRRLAPGCGRFLLGIPEDDPDLLALQAMGCFRSGAFDPGPEGAEIAKRWQLADEALAGPRDLLTGLVRAANRNPKSAPVGIPRQVTAPEVPAPAS
jgi:hypothetical protein